MWNQIVVLWCMLLQGIMISQWMELSYTCTFKICFSVGLSCFTYDRIKISTFKISFKFWAQHLYHPLCPTERRVGMAMEVTREVGIGTKAIILWYKIPNVYYYMRHSLGEYYSTTIIILVWLVSYARQWWHRYYQVHTARVKATSRLGRFIKYHPTC